MFNVTFNIRFCVLVLDKVKLCVPCMVPTPAPGLTNTKFYLDDGLADLEPGWGLNGWQAGQQGQETRVI
jgi:hypothetical protein